MIVAMIPWGIHNTLQYLVLEYLYFLYVARGCTPLRAGCQSSRWVLELVYITAIYYAQKAEISSQVASTFFVFEVELPPFPFYMFLPS
jgi:hypothetical protein